MLNQINATDYLCQTRDTLHKTLVRKSQQHELTAMKYSNAEAGPERKLLEKDLKVIDIEIQILRKVISMKNLVGQ